MRILFFLKACLLVVFCLGLVSCDPAVKYTEKVSREPTLTSSGIIPIYDVGTFIPPNAIVIGEVKISDSGFSTNCSLNVVEECARKQAREVGGEAIVVTKLVPPDIISTCYRMNADILVFNYNVLPENWPAFSQSEEEVRKYLDNNSASLSAIEGIWKCNEGGTWSKAGRESVFDVPYITPYQIAIIKNNLDNDYQYVAFLLETDNQNWQTGSIKAYFNASDNSNEFLGIWYNDPEFPCNSIHTFDSNGILRASTMINEGEFEYNLRTALEKIYP